MNEPSWKRRATTALFLAGFAGAVRPAGACTAFLLDTPSGKGGSNKVVGKCYDWTMGQGFVVLNPRGLKKRALPMLPGDHPAEWAAKYASVTFNQYGREFPNGGMNEAGLVVEILWLDGSRFAPPDERPTVNELQWIQRELDLHASVAEMVADAPAVRVARVHGDVHYFACDRGGACASFEHLDGKLVVSSGASMPAPVLTNDPYAQDAARLREQAGFGEHRGVPEGASSPARFVRAAMLARASGRDKDATEAAFRVLDAVNNPSSQWHIVYEPAAGRIHFRSRASNRRKWIDVARVIGGAAGACAPATRFMNIDVDLEGDVSGYFGPLADAANRRLVLRSFRDLADKLPAGAIDAVAKYPASLSCATPPK